VNEPSIHAKDKMDELQLDTASGKVEFHLGNNRIDADLIEEDGKFYLRLQTGSFRILQIRPLGSSEILISVVGGGDG